MSARVERFVPRGFRAVFFVAALASAAPAWAELAEIAWDTNGAYSRTFEVPPGKFAEACGKLARSDAVRWSWEAGGNVSFNIHYHEGDKVEYPVKQAGVPRAQGTLDVAKDQDYCWMWTNKSPSTFSLRVQLSRARKAD